MTGPHRITANDFFTGIFAALALQQENLLLSIRPINRMDGIFAKLFKDLQKEAQEGNLDIRFRIKLHPIHGDSSTVQDALLYATMVHLITWDPPDFRLNITSEYAESTLSSLPGSQEMYERLAKEFMRYYEYGAG